MANYGFVFTKDAVKSQLKNLNRTYEGRKTWGEYYGAIDVAKRDALSQLEQDYSSDVLEAYSTAQKNKALVANSDLGTGFKEQAFNDIDMSLMDAYNTYRQKYAENVQAVETNIDTQKASIDKALSTEAENIKSYMDSPYLYLQDLYNRAYGYEDYYGDDKLVKLFENQPQWNKYLTDELDSDGNPTGNKVLLSENELRSKFYNDDGTINIEGVDFYDQMMNQLGVELGSEYGYGEWLNRTNPELFEWSQSYNPYDYTLAGTKSGTVKTMMGMMSTDDAYQYIERFAGWDKNKIDSEISKLSDFELNTTSGVNEAIDNIEKWSEDLGIHDEITQEIGGWDNLKRSLAESESIEGVISSLENAKNQSYGNQAVGAVSGTAAGATIGSAGGPIGMLAGALIGTIFGAIVSDAVESSNRDYYDSQKEVEEGKLAISKENTKNTYLQLLTNLSEYMHSKQRVLKNTF